MRLGAPVRNQAGAGGAPAALATTLPYDYAAVFPLRGQRGNILQDVISISPESDFVALGMSYGFQTAPTQPLGVPLQVLQAGGLPAGQLTLSAFSVDALVDGVRLNPRFVSALLDVPPGIPPAELDPVNLAFSQEPQSVAFLGNAFERFVEPRQIEFLLTIIDTATGRELQDQPVSNLASLGESSGRRPFRLFSQPLFLQRRSTLRLQVTEESEGAAGELFLVLFGYKSSVDPCARPPADFSAGARMLPFDYVARVSLTGVAGRRVEREIVLDTRGGLRVNAVGYALQTGGDAVSVENNGAAQVDLGALPLSAFPVSAWIEGIRLRPSLSKLALIPGAGLNPNLPLALINRVFQRLNQPEKVQFRYEIIDGGTNRPLQNRPVFNIAGLGSADGRRPFKRLLKPLEFGPRSTLRIAVEEDVGRGDLFLVFQGYRFDDSGLRGVRR